MTNVKIYYWSQDLKFWGLYLPGICAWLVGFFPSLFLLREDLLFTSEELGPFKDVSDLIIKTQGIQLIIFSLHFWQVLLFSI